MRLLDKDGKSYQWQREKDNFHLQFVPLRHLKDAGFSRVSRNANETLPFQGLLQAQVSLFPSLFRLKRERKPA